MKFKLITLISTSALMVLTLSLIIYFYPMFVGLTKILDYHEDMHRQKIIADAIINFTENHNLQLPEDLSEIVEASLLPETSTIYSSAYTERYMEEKHYSDSDYEIGKNPETDLPIIVNKYGQRGEEEVNVLISGRIKDGLLNLKKNTISVEESNKSINE